MKIDNERTLICTGEVGKETTIAMEGAPLTEGCIWRCGSTGTELAKSK